MKALALPLGHSSPLPLFLARVASLAEVVVALSVQTWNVLEEAQLSAISQQTAHHAMPELRRQKVQFLVPPSEMASQGAEQSGLRP